MNRDAASPSELPADNRRALRQVARACRKASLATLLAADGGPYASLVTVAFDHDLAPVLLLSGISDHTRNLRAEPRLSLLCDGTDGHPNPQTGPRVTFVGTAAPDDDPRLAARFLARHPGAARYAGFGDFAFWRVTPARAHFVGGFGRAVWFDAPFGLDPAASAALAAAEAEILAHMNADHAQAADLIARRLGGGGEGGGEGWRMIALDPDGCEFAAGERTLRVAFERPLDGPAAARTALADLARRARG